MSQNINLNPVLTIPEDVFLKCVVPFLTHQTLFNILNLLSKPSHQFITSNKKSIELKVSKKIKYPIFYKIIITDKVAEELGLNKNLPFVDIQERIKNKSFIAKKAVTFSEEQTVSDKAPVTKVKIDDISTIKDTKTNKTKKYSIIVGDFYSKESAENLIVTLEHKYIKKGSLKLKKVAKNKFRLLAGPYSSINTLKKRYFELNKYGFEDLDIKQND